MIYLGEFKAGDTVFYAANFHNDQGTIEDPTSPEAQTKNPAGTWSALTAPAKQNTKTGHYGGTIDTTGFAAGQHIIRMAGTVATAKTVATEFCFYVVAKIASDLDTKIGTPAGASMSSDILAIDNFVDDLESRLTATRAGYLDNLSAGAVALEATLSNMKGATFNTTTDSLEALRDRGDVAWITATGFIQSGVTMTEGYAADGTPATLEQMLYMIYAVLGEFAISGTTITCKKLDGSTTAMTFTLNSATDPTSRTRTT